ncbi:MAG: hypothetical protein QF473_16235 [Planctomycetota bacterium]|jgi:chromosome segregation ATPase|nr:hypothetical protein [Planctomycetota bacterium]
MRISSIALMALLCSSSVFAQEAVDANKEKMAAIQKETREINKKLAIKKKALAKDPDIQAANEAAQAKQKEAQDAREAVYAKIAEKNPEFKELLASRNALKTKITATKSKEKELNDIMAKAKADLAELKKAAGTSAKDYSKSERDLLTKARPHMKDADLKDLLDSVKAADTAYREAAKVPAAKAEEKDPEYKELSARRTELYKELSALRPKKNKTRANKEKKPRQARPNKKKKKAE